jgi:hypothetical protein
LLAALVGTLRRLLLRLAWLLPTTLLLLAGLRLLAGFGLLAGLIALLLAWVLVGILVH